MQIKGLDPERQKSAVRYEEIQRRLTIIEWAITGIFLLVLVFGGISRMFARFLVFPQPLSALIYFIVLGLALTIVTSPIAYYGGFVLPRRYGLSIQKLPSWLADRLKSGAIALVMGLALVAFVYWTLEQFPEIWWLLASLFVILVSLLITRFAPTFLISIFFKLEPMKDEELKARLMGLAERTGTNVNGVFTMNLSTKGTTANAMLAGLGNTRRIIITDTLLEKYTPEEIEVVLAHELGHHVLKHIPNLILVQAATFLLTFYLVHLALVYGAGPLGFNYFADTAAFPYILLVMSVISLLMSPILNAYSRQLENNADKVALHLTDNPEAFISMMTRLMDQNLSVAQPSRWVEIMFYDHPPYLKRIKTAKDYIEAHPREDRD
jgi:STE24 endopeptidase